MIDYSHVFVLMSLPIDENGDVKRQNVSRNGVSQRQEEQ